MLEEVYKMIDETCEVANIISDLADNNPDEAYTKRFLQGLEELKKELTL